MAHEKFKISTLPIHSNFAKMLILAFLLHVGTSAAQNKSDFNPLIENSILVESTIDQAWSVLANFAGVGRFHVLYDETNALNGSEGTLEVGAERESLMPDGMYNLILRERVVDLVDGAYFTFEVYQSEKAALESMRVTYGVISDEQGKVRIYNQVAFKDGSKVWKNFKKRKLNRDSQISLISYKHRIETGGSEKDLKRLKDWFDRKAGEKEEGEFIATSDLEAN